MSDLYTEVIVKRKTGTKEIVLKSLLIAGTILAVLALLAFGLIGLILLAAMAAADYFLFPAFSVEYEYLYVNGELDIDKIMSKQKRKRVYSTDVKKIELMAPTNSHALDSYRNRNDMKRYDFTSAMPDQSSFTMVIKGEKGLEMVAFEPNDIILKDMKRMAPREVNLY